MGLLQKISAVLLLHSNAKKIRSLLGKWTTTTVQLGAELSLARQKTLTQGITYTEWSQWLKKEIGISTSYANRVIRAYTKFGQHEELSGLSMKMLILLAQDNTPQAAIDEVVQNIKVGKKIRKIRKIIERHFPPPKEANKIARETGRPQMASDGYLYLGNTAEEVKAGDLRRTLVYDVREAVAVLAQIELSPAEFLRFALPHQLWKPEETVQIDRAVEWLQALHQTWHARNFDHDQKALTH